jgi:peptidoglycan/LPS O-acetylase OafA/YrhL
MRIEQLTFTRFIAAISIVIFHYGSNSFPFNNHYVQFIFKQANVGVSYFFILSGFVMIIAYNKGPKINYLNYLKNRFARIYPIYFIAIVLILILSILAKKIDFEGLFLNLFMLQAWIPEKALSFNFPGWSLSVELFFYVLFPFLFNSIYSKIRFTKLIYPIIIIWLFSQILFFLLLNHSYFKEFPLSSKDLSYFPLMHLNEFLIGNLAGIYFINKKTKPQNFDIQITVIILTIIVALKYPIGLNFHNGLLAIFFIPLIILIASNNGNLTTFSNHKTCIFLGEISFGIYILQNPVWQWISDYRLEKYLHIDKVENSTLSFFVRLFVLILFSSLSYLYLETPIRNRIKKLQLKNSFTKFGFNT